MNKKQYYIVCIKNKVIDTETIYSSDTLEQRKQYFNNKYVGKAELIKVSKIKMNFMNSVLWYRKSKMFLRTKEYAASFRCIKASLYWLTHLLKK